MASRLPSTYNQCSSQDSQAPSFLSPPSGCSSTPLSHYSFSQTPSSSSQPTQSAPHFSDRNLFEIIKRNLNRGYDPKQASEILNEKTIEFLSKKQFSAFKCQLAAYAQTNPECKAMLDSVVKALFWSHQRALSTTHQWTLNKTFKLLNNNPLQTTSAIAKEHPHLLPFLRNYSYEEIQEAFQEFYFDHPESEELYSTIHQLYRTALENGPIWHIASQLEGIDLSQPAGLTIEDCLMITGLSTWQQKLSGGEHWPDIYLRIKGLLAGNYPRSTTRLKLEIGKLHCLGADLSRLQRVLDLQTPLENGPPLFEQLSFLAENSFHQDQTTYFFAKCRDALVPLKEQMLDLSDFPIQELIELVSSRTKRCKERLHQLQPKKILSTLDQFLEDYNELIYHTSLAMMLQSLKRSLEEDSWPPDLEAAWDYTLNDYPKVDTNLIFSCENPKELEFFLHTLWYEYTKEDASLAAVDLKEILKKSFELLSRKEFKKINYQLKKGNSNGLITILLEAFQPFYNLPAMKQWCLNHF